MTTLYQKICLLTNNDTLTEMVSDEYQTEKLGFNMAFQIEAIYRLRRGCEKTIYWTDNNNKPMFYIIGKDSDFQNELGKWEKAKFYIIKSYTGIPTFTELEVRDSGGSLQPGSIEVFIQYLDENLNPTEFITGSGFINIYHSSLGSSYKEIVGGVNRPENGFQSRINFKIITNKIR